jgi:uncharacterized protein YneF (UPF0154 family)
MRNIATLAKSSMKTQKMEVKVLGVIGVCRHCQSLGNFQLRAIMGQQLSDNEKCYVRTVKQLLITNGAIVSEDQIGKMLSTVTLWHPWFPE